MPGSISSRSRVSRAEVGDPATGHLDASVVGASRHERSAFAVTSGVLLCVARGGGATRDPPFAPARVFSKLIFYMYMIFDVSDAEAKRVAAASPRR